MARKSEAASVKDIDRHMHALSIDLQHTDVLHGSELSLADINVYVQLKWISENPGGRAAIGPYQNVMQWMDRVDQSTQKRA